LGFGITEANAMALNEFLKTGKMPVWAEVFNSKFIPTKNENKIF